MIRLAGSGCHTHTKSREVGRDALGSAIGYPFLGPCWPEMVRVAGDCHRALKRGCKLLDSLLLGLCQGEAIKVKTLDGELAQRSLLSCACWPGNWQCLDLQRNPLGNCQSLGDCQSSFFGV